MTLILEFAKYFMTQTVTIDLNLNQYINKQLHSHGLVNMMIGSPKKGIWKAGLKQIHGEKGRLLDYLLNIIKKILLYCITIHDFGIHDNYT